MPLAVLHIPEDALSGGAIAELVVKVTQSFLAAQGASPGSEAAASICRVEVEIHPRRQVFIGGQAHDGQPLYRAEFWTPEAAVDLKRVEALFSQVTDAFLSAEGADVASVEARYRVWCLVHPVREGLWGCAGQPFSWRKIRLWVGRRDVAARRRAEAAG
jgi:hypothetical protein